MDQRLQFVTDALSDRFTMTELCVRYGVASSANRWRGIVRRTPDASTAEKPPSVFSLSMKSLADRDVVNRLRRR